MTSLEERYKKAYANFEKAAAEYYPLLKEFREKAKTPGYHSVLGLDAASAEFRKTIPIERVLDQKLKDKLNRDIDKMPLPLDVRRIVKDYTGPLNEPRTEPLQAQAAKTGGRGRKTRKTRRRV